MQKAMRHARTRLRIRGTPNRGDRYLLTNEQRARPEPYCVRET